MSSTPMLQGQILTENDHEDNLMNHLDELIHSFLIRPTRRDPFRTRWRWTFNDEQNISYSVEIKIEASSISPK
ncbi:unnamed protein product [Adineta steineri]|uniref:Uncharacterized protein n=1 Tax=Adineta steineri TaxID=433720 RepID=A0A819FGR0_9BILA|nr:unnamed protein product [Adineta steineri]CAF3865313.1 unnamed protein product [Adineta steineri]